MLERKFTQNPCIYPQLTRNWTSNVQKVTYTKAIRPPYLPHKIHNPHYCCTSLFHLLGAGGKPPFGGGPLDPGLECGPSDGAGAGRMGSDMMFWLVVLVLDDVRVGYGRGGAGALLDPLEPA